MVVKEVAQKPLRTPFYPRLAERDSLHAWHDWNGYTVPDALYCAETEYFAVRNAAAVFDLSPMSKYLISGPDALAYLDRLVTRDVRKITPGRVGYAVWCNDQGQVVDDGTLFHLREGEYRLCAQERQLDWLVDSAIGFDVSIVDETSYIAALAVQGPTSFSVLEAMGLSALADLKPFRVAQVAFGGGELSVSRTGFTGDLGYELWVRADSALELWDRLFAAGGLHGIRAMGTDALNLARIEAGYLQAGVDFLPANATVRTGRSRSPLELGLDWLVDFTKPNFNGRRALAEEKRRGSRWRLVKLDIEGNKPAHNAYVFAKPRGKQQEVGFVTSAAWSPVCKQNLAIASVKVPHGTPGTDLWVEIYYQRELHWSRVMARGTVVERPFWFPPRRSLTSPGAF